LGRLGPHPHKLRSRGLLLTRKPEISSRLFVGPREGATVCLSTEANPQTVTK
jgi:hypothetical protein